MCPSVTLRPKIIIYRLMKLNELQQGLLDNPAQDADTRSDLPLCPALIAHIANKNSPYLDLSVEFSEITFS